MPDEEVIVVDAADNVIGHKRRDQLTYSDIYRVSALWLTNSHGEVLVAQRKWTKTNNPGKWGPAVAGTVAHGETYEANIYKEAEEEIGLTGVRFTSADRSISDDGLHRYHRQWFTASVDWALSDFTIQESEVEQIKWINRDELALDVAKYPDKYTHGVATRCETHP